MTQESTTPKPAVLEGRQMPVLFVDHLSIASRVDGVHLLQLYSELPGGWSEQIRLMIPTHALKAMVDVMSKHLESLPAPAPQGSEEKN